ncbi:MAG: BrnA antitoxin family protein [Planctomycetaceae bacterium]|nr:BrnA antitoxin family protein [Planctomycetaceae bacterium]
MKDSEIDTSDIPELDDEFFAKAKLVVPPPKQAVSIRLDADVVDWFKRKGRGYQTRINGILRIYVEHEKKASGK